jgi:transposase
MHQPHYRPHLTKPLPWRPLRDDELEALKPYFVHRGAGRPMHDIRARLDAIFWAVTHNGRWRDLPPAMGPWDTAHRQFRRWVHKGVWTQLLKDVAATTDPVLKRLEHWLCRAFRRGLRLLGLAGIRLARRLGLHSALHGPIWMVPDPDLSEALLPLVLKRLKQSIGPNGLPDLAVLRAAQSFHRVVGGRAYIPRRLAPP